MVELIQKFARQCLLPSNAVRYCFQSHLPVRSSVCLCVCLSVCVSVSACLSV